MNEEIDPKSQRLKKLRQMMTWICIALAVVTLFGHAGRFWWLFDLFSHFRLQLSLSCLVVAVVLFLTGTRFYAGIALLFCVVNIASLSSTFPVGSSTIVPEKGTKLRLLLSNVKTQTGSPEQVLEIIRKYDPDVIVLEEVGSRWIPMLRQIGESYPYFEEELREDNFGIAVYSRIKLTRSEVVYIGTAKLPSIQVTLDLATDQHIHVLATHPLPPMSGQLSLLRNEQIGRIAKAAANLRPMIVVGDLNTTPWNYHFRQLREKANLIDSSSGFGYQATWPTYNPLLSIPLDHVLHSNEIITVNRQIGPDVGSDHFPVIVDLALISPDDDSQK